MGQYVCPSDTSIKWTLHLPMMEFCLTFLCFIFTITLRLYRCFFPPVLKLSSVLLKRAESTGIQVPAPNSASFVVNKHAAQKLPVSDDLPTADIPN